MYHFKVQEDGTTSCALQMKLQKYFLFSHNHDDSTLIALGDVVSSNNVARFDNISSVSNSQQPKIDVPNHQSN